MPELLVYLNWLSNEGENTLDEQMMTLAIPQANEEAGKKSKKAYEKPQIIYSLPLEAMAGACNSGSPGGKAVVGVCLPIQSWSRQSMQAQKSFTIQH